MNSIIFRGDYPIPSGSYSAKFSAQQSGNIFPDQSAKYLADYKPVKNRMPLLVDQETMNGKAELLDAIKTVNHVEHENYKMDLVFNGQWHKCM